MTTKTMDLDSRRQNVDSSEAIPALDTILERNAALELLYTGKLHIDEKLNRSLVSFQANKRRAFYRWFKYKEAFSAGLVEHLLDRCGVTEGVLLDPFAGIGTALFAAGEMGLKADGIELLPIGQRVISTKQRIDWDLETADVPAIARWAESRPWRDATLTHPVNELRITKGAYPDETMTSIGRYVSVIERENPRIRDVLFFALLCVLEAISFTRKDGQYLRWDHRSGRRIGKKAFDKGRILTFDQAIVGKLKEIVSDLRAESAPKDLFGTQRSRAAITLRGGSCLGILPKLQDGAYDCILTSPPYCNRYDYTRTYALELALLGVDEAGLLALRQEMLSCTVENRAKDLQAMHPQWSTAIAVADRQQLLQSILTYLDDLRDRELLNNSGIPRMVRGYFYEMACVIAECSRVLKEGSPLIMVNDNVRYAGASVSVDLILSDFASELGFNVEDILVLPNGKGNSSQQMGMHGRDVLRKCVYVWRKK
jgi:DNA modification methylase